MLRAGYCFVNLRSAIEFINVLDASMLSISPDEFERCVYSKLRTTELTLVSGASLSTAACVWQSLERTRTLGARAKRGGASLRRTLKCVPVRDDTCRWKQRRRR